MAGGVGSRFWPASKESRPKQFLDILGTGRSLIQMTFDRFEKLVPAENIYILTHEKYRDLIKKHLPKIKDHQIIGEPSRNNTAPCVAFASLKLHQLDSDATCIVSPADHIILKEESFLNKCKTALEFANANDALLTLGIQPTRPDTGYGYINYDLSIEPKEGVYKVKQFKEKPAVEIAAQYVAEGNYVWNSGMFIWSLNSIVEAFRTHANNIYEVLAAGYDKYNTDAENEFIEIAYPTTEKISIDYAIMERAKNVYTIPADIGWSDLGTWASLYEELFDPLQKNVQVGDKQILIDSAGCMVRSGAGKLIVAKGLKDYIIIQEDDAVLIYPRADEQEIKQVTSAIKDKGWKSFL